MVMMIITMVMVISNVSTQAHPSFPRLAFLFDDDDDDGNGDGDGDDDDGDFKH